MRFKNVVTTLLVGLFLVLFVVPAHAQRVIATPSTYASYAYVTAVYTSSATPGSATPANIVQTPLMIYGLSVNAGANTAGVQVWANFFNAKAADVTAGTTAALFSVPLQAGGTSNTLVAAQVVPFGSPIGLPISTALSFNCTTLKNGTVGTQVPCNANAITKP